MENLVKGNYVEVTFLKYHYAMQIRLHKEQYLDLGKNSYLYDATALLGIKKNDLVVVETIYGLGVGVVKEVGVTEHPQITAGFEIKKVCGIISTYDLHNQKVVKTQLLDLEKKFKEVGEKYLKNKNHQLLLDAGMITAEELELYRLLQAQVKEE